MSDSPSILSARKISIDSDLCLNLKASEIANLATKKRTISGITLSPIIMGVETGCIWMYLKGNWLSEGPIFFTSMFPGRKGSTCVCPGKTSPGCRPRCWILGLEGDAGWYAKNTIWQLWDPGAQWRWATDRWIDGWVDFFNIFSFFFKLGNEKIKYNLGRFEGSFWVLEWCCCDVLVGSCVHTDVRKITQKPHLSSGHLAEAAKCLHHEAGRKGWCLISSDLENQRMQMLLLMVPKSGVYQSKVGSLSIPLFPGGAGFLPSTGWFIFMIQFALSCALFVML